MSDQIFIPGFTAFGRKVPRFIIGKSHTVFEWVMIYRDHHPACFHDHNGTSLEDMRMRLDFLGAGTFNMVCDAHGKPMVHLRNEGDAKIMNEVYRDLERDIKQDRIKPLRGWTYCDDAHANDVFDPTHCLIDIEPILAIARVRQNFGETVAKLLAANEKPEPPQDSAAIEHTQTKLEKMAEWVFGLHNQSLSFDQIYGSAKNDPRFVGFTKNELIAAYQMVYSTKKHRRPAGGWPLRSPYSQKKLRHAS